MIKGLGIDVVDVKRFKKLAGADSFLKRIFTPREISYCRKKKNSSLNLAGRFAVKEAFIKAVSDNKRISLKQIETVNNEDGKPDIVLNDAVKKLLKKKRAKKVIISITHTEITAAAVCILE
ncbi:MAG TPA: holo-[acyl-carrier-protein] synthase [bacterium]|nr:holo-[acyl-carrier-protein] synthase [bacterium]